MARYKCDYCDVELANFTELRQHVITQVHARNKAKKDLSIENCKKHLDSINNRPDDINKLFEACQFRTTQDIEQQKEFFNIENDNQSALCKQMIDVLLSEIAQFRIMQLPQEMRGPFKDAVMKNGLDTDKEKSDASS